MKALLAAAALLAASTPALAITDGSLDGTNHPYVGLMIAKDALGVPQWRCTGTLLSPTLFLTAGHCTESPAVEIEIWFDADVTAGRPGNGYPRNGRVGGVPHTHPQYNPNAFLLYDLGVVILDTPWELPQYGVLPALNELDALDGRRGQKDVTFTAVGYGLQNSNKNHLEAYLARYVAYPKLNQINTGFTGDFSILLSNNANTGGTCFGDSGGPNFIAGSRVLAGVTSYGINSQCAGTGGVYRVDRSDDLDWLYSTFRSHLP